MAPYVFTPAIDGEEIISGVDTRDPTHSSTSNTTAHTNGNTDGAGDANSNANRNSSSSTPTSATSYETAYIHGYKDGYIKSHAELKHQPIAIVGMSCRFPGNVSTPDEFWELLARSRTGFSDIPSSRFSSNRFFHPNPGKSGTTNARGGNFLTHDLTVFDAPFFGFTQQEAVSLDPQQRLLLECTFESLESAGIPKHEIVGKDVGVFVGGTFSDYDADLFRDAETMPMHQATGCHMAMHLRHGDSTMAIAAGVHLNMLPEFWISMSMSRLLGEAGRSFAFDQRGSGYGRGEGCAMLLLKPLDQAIRDNDPIRAVIAGTGINQDGKTPGITMPNGIAGVIKTALMLERGFILPNYDFKHPNEKLPLDTWGFKVPIRQQPWPLGKKWASVNGFGFGGTNGHVVMTKGPLERKKMNDEIDTQVMERLFLISGNDKVSTESIMSKLGVYLEQRPEVFQNDLLSNLAYTLGQRKSLHPWRVAITASTAVELVEALSSGKIFPAKQEFEAPRLGWVFTGQGAQWWAMGRELYQQYPVYAAALDKADSHLRSIGADFSLLEELSKDEANTLVNAAHISQPSCTAVQLALTDLLRSWHIYPSAVTGHSSGEIGAAYAAGIINFDDAMTIAFHRGRLIPILKQRFPDLDGCMMAVGCGPTEIAPLLERIESSHGEAKIACINSPSSVTISGDSAAIAELQALLKEESPDMFFSSLLGREASVSELDASYWVQNLTCAVRFDEAVQSMCQSVGDSKTGVNFLVELGPHAALQGPIKQILKHVGGPAAKIPYSSVLSRKKNADQTALALVGSLFVKGSGLNMAEINFPKPLPRPPQVLTDMPRYSWNHSTKFWHESRLTEIHKFHDAPRNDIIGVLATYSTDLEPTWRNVVRLDDLPWLHHHQMQGVTIFPISGFASMAFEAMAQRAKQKDFSFESLEIQNLHVVNPVMLVEEDVEMTITLRPSSDNVSTRLKCTFYIRSWSKAKGWTENCTGSVSCNSADRNDVDSTRTRQTQKHKLRERIAAVSAAATEPLSSSVLYERLSEIGVSYGATFQGLHDCRTSCRASTARVVLADTSTDMPHHFETNYILHPTILESLISMYWPILSTESLETVHLPSSIGKITVSTKVSDFLTGPGACLQAHCEPFDDLLITPLHENAVNMDAESARELCYRLEWEPALQPSGETDNFVSARFNSDIVIVHGDSNAQLAAASVIADHLASVVGNKPITGSLTAIASIAKDKLCIFLNELDQPVLSNLDEAQFEALQLLLTSVQGLLWVVRGAYANSINPDANMIAGLSRTLRSEGTLMKFITLDLDGSIELDSENMSSAIFDVFASTLNTDSQAEETEFMVRDGKLFTPRIVNDETMNEYVNDEINPPATEPTTFADLSRPLRGSITTSGALDSIVFEDDKVFAVPLLADEVDIQVKAIGLSTSDVQAGAPIGREASGIVTAVGHLVHNVKVGDRVAALTPAGSLSTVTRTPCRFLLKLPDHISFESAALIPVAYCAASYALIDNARLMENDTVLVYDAASAIGQAALVLAQMIGADVWATAKSAGDKELLKREFGISEERIFYSRSDSFAGSIRDATSGRGVDVVLNTVTDGCLLRTAWSCLADFGRFINVGAGPFSMGDAALDRNASVFSVDVTALSVHRPRVLERLLVDVERLMKYGKLQPAYGIKSFGIGQTAAALQSGQTSNEGAKIVILPRDDELIMAPRIAKGAALLRSDATYILIGGTGGLGRSIATWMVGKGAKHIVLLSRSGELKGKAKEQIDALNESGAAIIVRRCDVSTRADVEHLISTGLEGLPPVRGLIHGAMVLHDVLFEKMTYDQYTSVIASKVQGTKNLHDILSSSSTPLDFFICISSAAGAVGNRGQAAYAAANTFLNGFAQQLRSQGILATSIDLTAVSDAGYLAEDAEKAAEVARNLGSDTICEAEVLSLIQASIEGKMESCNGHPITGMRITPTVRPFWSNDAKFVHLLRAAEAAASLSSSATAKVSWSAAFKAASDRAEAEVVVCNALVEKIAEVISMEPEELDVTRALSHYPLDSLTAIEVRNFITRMFEANLQVLELLASGSIESLAKVVCGKSKGRVQDG
ncbi:hypothetical protein BS50DRAFT_562674 [Corynespora cassiicola Philippines]|uniref:Uncharacterized protein n=1 Tax=Corynespora cassiicola Philippines TaxID=1448308 RepID=A0A2T2N702_CORCC|nr:hypothetical protein BS50DRAFT_562674 [Corynespora cassiicola Philippines]